LIFVADYLESISALGGGGKTKREENMLSASTSNNAYLTLVEREAGWDGGELDN